MSMKDTDDPNSSYFSCDESDLEECEARLYSMVYHNSSSYDDEPTPSQCSTVGKDHSPENHLNSADSIPNGICDVVQPKLNNRPIFQDNFEPSARNKASRLDRVNEIISVADSSLSNVEVRLGKDKLNVRENNNKNMFSKRQNASADNPKTASLYFQNLTKSLNNVHYLQTVEQRLTKPSSSFKEKSSSKPNSPPKNAFIDLSKSPGRDKTSSGSFYRPAEANRNYVSGTTPTFRLDDRLFPNIPRNTSREEFELSHRLFSNKPDSVPVDRDRHNHCFSQLPTIPIPSTSPLPKKGLTKKLKKKKKPREKHKKINQPPSVQGFATPAPEPAQANENVVVPAIVSTLNSIFVQQNLSTSTATPNVDHVAVPLKESEMDSHEVVNLDSSLETNVISLDADVLVLDSDSDSVASVVVVTPPARTPPPLISLDESDEDTPTEKSNVESIPLHPVLETEHVENSFDFLDSCDDLDALRKSQVSLFSNMISSSGSKESLLDDRFFQPQDEGTDRIQFSKQPGTETEYLQPTRTTAKQPSADSVHSQIVCTTQTSTLQSLGVNINVSSSNHAGPTCANSDRNIQSQVLDSVANVRNDVCIDLAINITSNTPANDAPQSAETILLDTPSTGASVQSLGEKRKLQQDEEGSNIVTKKKKKAKKGSKRRAKQWQLNAMGLTKNTEVVEPVEYTKIEGPYYLDKSSVLPKNPPQWTREMKQFYNESWGGENFSVKDIQATMSKASNWHVSWADLHGPQPLQGPYKRMRCFNCARFGHPINMCPEPRRMTKCHMCGEVGHKWPHCPSKICLECGRPNRDFLKGCCQCHNNRFPLCTKCIWKHDPSSHCLDVQKNAIPPEVSNNLWSEPDHQHSSRTPGTNTRAPTEVPRSLQQDDLRLRLEQKRAKLVGVGAGHASGPRQADTNYSSGPNNLYPKDTDISIQSDQDPNGYMQAYFEKKRQFEPNQLLKHSSSLPVQKQSYRRSRP